MGIFQEKGNPLTAISLLTAIGAGFIASGCDPNSNIYNDPDSVTTITSKAPIRSDETSNHNEAAAKIRGTKDIGQTASYLLKRSSKDRLEILSEFSLPDQAKLIDAMIDKAPQVDFLEPPYAADLPSKVEYKVKIIENVCEQIAQMRTRLIQGGFNDRNDKDDDRKNILDFTYVTAWEGRLAGYRSHLAIVTKPQFTGKCFRYDLVVEGGPYGDDPETRLKNLKNADPLTHAFGEYERGIRGLYRRISEIIADSTIQEQCYLIDRYGHGAQKLPAPLYKLRIESKDYKEIAPNTWEDTVVTEYNERLKIYPNYIRTNVATLLQLEVSLTDGIAKQLEQSNSFLNARRVLNCQPQDRRDYMLSKGIVIGQPEFEEMSGYFKS